jgi:hypothetical protein
MLCIIYRLFEMLRNCFLLVAGYDVYLVGGCVRDLILKQTPKDFDIITSAELKEVFFFYSIFLFYCLNYLWTCSLWTTLCIRLYMKGWYLVKIAWRILTQFAGDECIFLVWDSWQTVPYMSCSHGWYHHWGW